MPPIFDSLIDSNLAVKSAVNAMKNRNVVLGGAPARGEIGDITLSNGSGSLSSSGALLSHPAWVELEVSKENPLVYVAIVDDRQDSNGRSFGAQLTTTGQNFIENRITFGNGRGFPSFDLTYGWWRSGTQVGPFANVSLPPIYWTIDYTGGATRGVKSYGFRIGGGTSLTNLQMTRIRIMAMEIFA